MANISTELERILAAVYGNEVRGSIHDAIEKINDVSEVVMSAGTAVSSTSSSTSGYYSGSLYYNTSTYDLWRCSGSAWELLGNLKGLKGDTGATGATGATGVGIQSVTDNGNGTFKFNLSNGTTTSNIATIKGEKGDVGATGKAGTNGRDVTNIQMTGTGKVHPISVTYSDGITQNIGTLQDGADGSGSGDMSFATYDPTQSGIVEAARALSDGTTTMPLSTVLNKATKADSLEGYGITDAYTKTEVDDLLNDQKVNVIDNLTSTSTENALSANQGRVLNNSITSVSNIEKNIIGGDAWVSGTSYSVNNTCIYNNKIYVCLKAHTSSASILPTNNTYWKETSISKLNSEIMVIDSGFVSMSIAEGAQSSDWITVSFSKTFTSTPLIVATCYSGTSVISNVSVATITSASKTGFQIKAWRNATTSSGGASPSFDWIAIGR